MKLKLVNLEPERAIHFKPDNDNSVVIKSTEDNPQNTNLVITEGERTHNFIVQYQKNVDINKVKLITTTQI
ncbi:MAG: hypothetical protein HWD58_11750 [Bacteroidota bacterium]|nr:MAG: hypothetical protein HWD58_11750 [Bacteroidota bacterium]